MIQWGSEYQKHLKTEHFCVRVSNGPAIALVSNFQIGHHVFDFQMVGQSKSGPFDIQTAFHHSKSGLYRYSDPLLIYKHILKHENIVLTVNATTNFRTLNFNIFLLD